MEGYSIRNSNMLSKDIPRALLDLSFFGRRPKITKILERKSEWA